MGNTLPTDKINQVIAALTEGSAIRSIERMTGIHRDTIVRLDVKVGQGCTKLGDKEMRELNCGRMEMDEFWGFVGKKARNVKPIDKDVGSVWTFCAIDAETKLVPAFKVWYRTTATSDAFMQDVASRMKKRLQVGNFEAAVGLHFAHYNFVKRHNTLRSTSAMAAGVTSSFWTVADLVEATS